MISTTLVATVATVLLVDASARAEEVVVSETIRVTPGAQDGFRWPYYLFIPAEAAEAIRAGHTPALLVAPNNTGSLSDDALVHDRAARAMCSGWNRWLAEQLGSPLLVPTFPRLAKSPKTYTHALDRDTLLTTEASLRRLDRQLLSMIADARTRLRQRHVETRGRVLLNGYSASAMFANRFALLHPDAVLAAAVGSPGGWPTLPIGEYKGQRLRYPVGVADLADVAGAPFDRAAFDRVHLFFYLGDHDTNDSVVNDDSYDERDKNVVMRLFGDTPAKRWPVAEAAYKSAGAASEFRLYQGVDHKPSQQMKDDVTEFFHRALDDKSGLDAAPKR